MTAGLTSTARQAMTAVLKEAQQPSIELVQRVASGVNRISFDHREPISLNQFPALGRIVFEIPDVTFKYGNSTKEKPVYVIAESEKDKAVAESIIRLLANNVEFGVPDNSDFSYGNVDSLSRRDPLRNSAWTFSGMADFTFFTNKDIFDKVKSLIGLTSPQTRVQERNFNN